MIDHKILYVILLIFFAHGPIMNAASGESEYRRDWSRLAVSAVGDVVDWNGAKSSVTAVISNARFISSGDIALAVSLRNHGKEEMVLSEWDRSSGFRVIAWALSGNPFNLLEWNVGPFSERTQVLRPLDQANHLNAFNGVSYPDPVLDTNYPNIEMLVPKDLTYPFFVQVVKDIGKGRPRVLSSPALIYKKAGNDKELFVLSRPDKLAELSAYGGPTLRTPSDPEFLRGALGPREAMDWNGSATSITAVISGARLSDDGGMGLDIRLRNHGKEEAAFPEGGRKSGFRVMAWSLSGIPLAIPEGNDEPLSARRAVVEPGKETLYSNVPIPVPEDLAYPFFVQVSKDIGEGKPRVLSAPALVYKDGDEDKPAVLSLPGQVGELTGQGEMVSDARPEPPAPVPAGITPPDREEVPAAARRSDE